MRDPDDQPDWKSREYAEMEERQICHCAKPLRLRRYLRHWLCAWCGKLFRQPEAV